MKLYPTCRADTRHNHDELVIFIFAFLPLICVEIDNYIDALDRDDYFTITDGEKSQRQRVINNLLGPGNFCPIVRKTSSLCAENAEFWQKRCEAINSNFPSALFHRALNFLYSKETKSSFAIEHLTPSATRIERFMAALQLAENEDFVEKRKLVALQNLIVDPRFKDHNYRLSQNYVGQSIAFQKEVIHYVCPKPDDLVKLMAGLLTSHQRMSEGQVSPVVHAAVIAYGFVFLHPFEDGNSRIHRFLIHNILARRGWQLCLQNNGRLSARKKVAHFDFLSTNELAEMEQAVQDGYINHDK